MPNRRIPSAMTTTSTAWKKRDRKRLMKWLFQGQEEGHEVDVLLRGQGLAEYRRHHALRKAGHRPHSRRIQDLGHDVIGRLDPGDLCQLRADLGGADLPRRVTRDAATLAREDFFTGLRVAGQLDLRACAARRGRCARRLRLRVATWRARS